MILSTETVLSTEIPWQRMPAVVKRRRTDIKPYVRLARLQSNFMGYEGIGSSLVGSSSSRHTRPPLQFAKYVHNQRPSCSVSFASHVLIACCSKKWSKSRRRTNLSFVVNKVILRAFFSAQMVRVGGVFVKLRRSSDCSEFIRSLLAVESA